ncbi:hypothetical protein F4805DRAFT_85848 [Annulohypoxylon moriforme]|nr:hypothetical protein F4805DRAFT_85848 [Annulohypoxylon moriforme]
MISFLFLLPCLFFLPSFLLFILSPLDKFSFTMEHLNSLSSAPFVDEDGQYIRRVPCYSCCSVMAASPLDYPPDTFVTVHRCFSNHSSVDTVACYHCSDKERPCYFIDDFELVTLALELRSSYWAFMEAYLSLHSDVDERRIAFISSRMKWNKKSRSCITNRQAYECVASPGDPSAVNGLILVDDTAMSVCSSEVQMPTSDLPHEGADSVEE